MKLNPLVLAIAAPPIPEVKGWARGYSGAAGPLIDLSQAVPSYPPPEAMLARLSAAAGSAAAAAYGDITGDADLRARYAAHVSDLYAGSIRPEDVAITAGCNMAFVVTMMALARAGDAVILPSPWYFNHKMTLDMLGIAAVPLPCRAEDGFVPDARVAETLVTPNVRAIVLVTPNNPTGAIYPADTIEGFAELCTRRGIALVIDETYRDFIDPAAGRPHGLFATDAWRQTVVQLYSFSKAYCIPGHRAGAIVADAHLIDELAKILDSVQISPPRVPQRALVWAIDAVKAWREQNRRMILDRAAAFRRALSGSNGWPIASIGAYFAYLGHPFPGRSANHVARWLARERGVLCLPGSYFGEGQESFLRVAFANVDEAAIAELPPRLAAVMAR